MPFPARHHRAQDELGELAPGRQHPPQRRAVECDHVRRLVGDALGDCRLAGEGSDVAQERPGVGLGDPDVLTGLAVQHPHPAALDDEKRGVALPLRIQRLPRRERPARAQFRQPLELAGGQPRIHHLVAEIGEVLGAYLGGCGSFHRHGHPHSG